MRRHVDVVHRVAHDQWEPPARADDEWDSLAVYARAHHVAHFLHGRIAAAGREASFPAWWLDALRAHVEQRRERAEALRDALAETTGALAAAGVECLVLKGRPFGVRYYGDPALRQSLDCDLLVRLADVDAALRVLAARGLEPRARRTRGRGERLRIRRRVLRTEHALGLANGRVAVDLHWRLRTAPAYRVREADLWSDAQHIAVDGRSYAAPSDEHGLLALLLGVAHDIGRRGCRLKHLLDVHQVVRLVHDATDWRAFLERRRAENALPIAVNVLDLARRLLAAPGEFPALAAALEAHAGLRAPGDPALLVHGLAGAWRHARWFLRVYPVSWPRDAAWMIDRRVAGLRSAPLLVYRAGAAGYWALRNRFAQRRRRG